ncbi:MAG: hypothetical protein Q9M36_11485 [Sulfurovum sp.]|nr:hypothetical protein [Sulfurovum sp.]
MQKFKISLIYLFVIFLLFGCDEASNDNKAEVIYPINKNKNILSSSKIKPKLLENINKSIAETETTYKKISDFRDALFRDSMYQGGSIICSANRILKLKSNTGAKEYVEKFKHIINKQSFLQFSSNDTSYDKYHYLDCRLQIQKSTQYINNSLNIKIYKSIGKSSYGRGQSGSLDYNICEAYYYKPIPNSKKAKEIEITNFAKIIAVSLRRLNMHEKRLPILESQTSTILSFESNFKKDEKRFSL